MTAVRSRVERDTAQRREQQRGDSIAHPLDRPLHSLAKCTKRWRVRLEEPRSGEMRATAKATDDTAVTAAADSAHCCQRQTARVLRLPAVAICARRGCAIAIGSDWQRLMPSHCSAAAGFPNQPCVLSVLAVLSFSRTRSTLAAKPRMRTDTIMFIKCEGSNWC